MPGTVQTSPGIAAAYPFNLSFTAFAGVNVSFLDAAIVIVAPVDGLRPSRAGLSCRVGATRYRTAPPLELHVQVSLHAAQASTKPCVTRATSPLDQGADAGHPRSAGRSVGRLRLAAK